MLSLTTNQLKPANVGENIVCMSLMLIVEELILEMLTELWNDGIVHNWYQRWYFKTTY